MPYTMNGVGTWYYGKSNLFTHEDFCPYCNRYVTLSSFDTREWFVIVFLPIIPLRKKRIINSCPVCTKHIAVPMKKYIKQKEDDYIKAADAYEANPQNPEAAAGLLGVFGSYQDLESFEEFAPQIAEQFPNDPKMMTTIGSTYYNYGKMEQARDYFEKSLALHSDDAVHEILGFVYLRQSEPDKAASHFQYILDKRILKKAGVLMSLVDGYQAKGRHQEALRLLEEIAQIDPEMPASKDYKKSLKLSQRYLQTGKPLKNKQFKNSLRQTALNGPFNSKRAWTIAAMVLAGLFLVYLGAAVYKGQRANVYLVNGLTRSYDVSLNGKVYALPERGYLKINIPTGKKELVVPDADLSIESSAFELKSSFLARPFSSRIYVINPDTVALLQWAKIFYSAKPENAPEDVWELYFGQTLYIFDRVNFPFKEFPDSISVSHSQPEARIQVRLVDEKEIPGDRIPGVIEHYFGIETKIDYLKKCIYYEPDNAMNIYNLFSHVDSQMFIETIRPGLDILPARVEWHRMYQQAMDQSNPQYDLVTEYRNRLEQTPDEAGLQYLYGRVMNDNREQATQWFQKSIRHPNPCAYGYYALGYDTMAQADYTNALSFYEKAMVIAPQNLVFKSSYYQMLIATNQLEAAAAYSRSRLSEKSDDYSWLLEYLNVLQMQGKAKQANEEFEQWRQRNREIYSEEDFQSLRKTDQLNAAYLRGIDAVHQTIGEPNDLGDKVVVALNSHKAIPDSLMAQSDSFPAMWLLLFYISESRLGNQDNASLFLAQACKQLEAGGYEERYIADCFNQPEKMNPEKISSLAMELKIKAVVLTAMGTRFPEHQKPFFELAYKLNYKKEFPYYFLNTILSGGKSE